MKNWFFLWFVCLIPLAGIFASGGHEISVTIENYEENEIYLAYYLMDKQYILDTVQADQNGVFTFEGEEPIPAGVYLVVLPPDNRYFQILINEEEQHFKAHTTFAQDLSENIRFEGSPENQLFYEYMAKLRENRPQAEILQAEIQAAESDPEREEAQQKLNKLNADIRAYQEEVVEKNPDSFTAAIIKSNLPMDVPEFEGDPQDVQFKKWQYTKNHYFDNLDLGDPRMLRTPFLFQRVDYFVNKLTVQHPDSINKSLENILARTRPAAENFKYYLVHFLNEYAKSKVIGFDAVYVFLAENYYASGQADWVDEEQLNKIIENAEKLKPLLIGKIAPNIKMQTRDEQVMWLHDVEAPYTILFFWDPECGHCKKSMPKMLEFYQNYKDKGVEVFAVCTKFYTELESCWDYIDESGMGIWLNTVDPYHRSRYKEIYDIRTTPQIYLLDHQKEILSKRLSAEQLPEVLDNYVGQPDR